jgi:hypothetical protein
MAGTAQLVRRCFQQSRLVAAVGFVANAAVLARRSMNNSGLPMDGYLRMACQADIRFLLCQVFLLPRSMGQMTSSALQGLEWFMDIFLFRDFLLYLGMALQTELSGLLMLHKGMLRGMSGMAAQTGSLFKRRMPLPAHRRFLVQIHMTGQA